MLCLIVVLAKFERDLTRRRRGKLTHVKGIAMGTDKEQRLSAHAAELRRQAEERLLAKSVKSTSVRTEEETERLVHQLEVHQIELEMQNEELCRTQRELEVSQARYFDLYDLAPVGYVTLSETGVILEANLAAATLLGVARGELLNRPFNRYILPNDKDVYTLFSKQVSAAGEPHTCEIRLNKPSLTTGMKNFVPVLLSSRVHDLSDGRVTSVTLTNLTQEKLNDDLMAAESFARTVAHERDILQNVMNGAQNSPLVYFDRDFNFVRVNEAYARTCGYRPEEMIGKNHFALYPDPEDEAVFARVRDAGDPVAYHDKPFVFPNQPERGVTWWDWTLNPVKDSSGLVTSLVFSLFETTERKRMEQELRQSVNRYRLLAETMLQGVVHQDATGTIIAMNPAAEQILGKSREEFLGSSSVKEEFHALRADGTPFPGGEHPAMVALRTRVPVRNVVMGVFNPRRNEYRWLNIDAVPLLPGDKSPSVEVYTVFADITEKRQTEETLLQVLANLEQRVAARTEELAQTVAALRTSEERYRSVVEDQTELIARFRPDGTYTFVNEVFCRFFGRHYREIVGTCWLPQAVPDDPPLIESVLQRISRDNPVVTIENRVIDAAGAIRWMQFVNRGFFGEHGELRETQAVGRDITPRKQAEEAYEESTRHFSTIFHASPIAIGISHCDTGKFLKVNEAFQNLFGYARDEIIGRTSAELELWPRPEERARMVAALQEQGRVQQFEAEYRHKSGSSGHLLIAVEQLNLAGEQCLMGLFSDITARKLAETLLANLNQQLEQQVAARTTELTMINTSLTREIGERLRIERDILEQQQRLQEMAQEMALAEDRERDRIAAELHDQVNQRLVLAKMRVEALARKLVLPAQEKSAEGICDLLAQTIADTRSLTAQIRPPLLAGAGLEAALEWLGEELQEQYGLRMELYDDHEPKVLEYGLRSFVFQAVRELLVNVAKHAGVPSARVEMKRDGSHLVITVADQGSGFDPVAVQSRKARSGGYGLFTVRQKIEYLGGGVPGGFPTRSRNPRDHQNAVDRCRSVRGCYRETEASPG